MIFNKKYNFRNKKQGGQVMILSVVFFVSITLTVIAGLVSPAVREFKISTDAIRSRQSLYLSESGAEDAYYRLKNLMTIGSSEVITLNGNTVTTTIDSSVQNENNIISLADVSSRQRKTQLKLVSTDGVSFQYGVQIGDGGIQLFGTSKLGGSTFTNGNIQGLSSASRNIIEGDAISAGGSMLYITTDTVGKANFISNSTIGTDAYYNSIINTTAGTYHPGSPDVADLPMPILDPVIDDWEADAVAGGTVTTPCPAGRYTINSNTTLGPLKINCNFLYIESNAVLTLTGPVWVTGDIVIRQNASVISNGPTGFALIADKTSDHTNSSRVTINTTLSTNSNPTYHVVLVSRNSSTSQAAIDVTNSNSSYTLPYILYAPDGKAAFNSSMNIKVISVKGLNVLNNAFLEFTTGPIDPYFPTFGWSSSIWKEIQ